MIKHLSNEFALDSDIIAKFLENHQEFNNDEALDNARLLSASLTNAKKVSIFNNSNLYSSYRKLTNGFSSNVVPILDKVVKSIGEIYLNGVEQDNNFHRIKTNELVNSEDKSLKTVFCNEDKWNLRTSNRIVIDYKMLFDTEENKGYRNIAATVKYFDSSSKLEENIKVGHSVKYLESKEIGLVTDIKDKNSLIVEFLDFNLDGDLSFHSKTLFRNKLKRIDSIAPNSFFSQFGMFPSDNYIIYDPHLFTSFQGFGKKQPILGFKVVDNERKLDEKSFKDVTGAMLFYVLWIEYLAQKFNFSPKIKFISRLESHQIKNLDDIFYMNSLYYKYHLIKHFDANTHIGNYQDEVKRVFKDEKNISILKKYFKEDRIELLAYKRSDKESDKVKIDLETQAGKDGEHRNIIMNDYMNCYWDRRQDFINSTLAPKKDHFKFRLGVRDEESQIVNVQSIFNEAPYRFKEGYEQTYKTVENMIYVSRKNRDNALKSIEKFEEYYSNDYQWNVRFDNSQEKDVYFMRYRKFFDFLYNNDADFKDKIDKKDLLLAPPSILKSIDVDSFVRVLGVKKNDGTRGNHSYKGEIVKVLSIQGNELTLLTKNNKSFLLDKDSVEIVNSSRF